MENEIQQTEKDNVGCKKFRNSNHTKLNWDTFLRAHRFINFLCYVFPATFQIKMPLPLSKGIIKEVWGWMKELDVDSIVNEEESNITYRTLSTLNNLGEVSYRLLTAAIQIYTSSITYRAALIKPDSMRIDLLGEEVEPVTDYERVYAMYASIPVRWEIPDSKREILKEIINKHKDNKDKRQERKVISKRKRVLQGFKSTLERMGERMPNNN